MNYRKILSGIVSCTVAAAGLTVGYIGSAADSYRFDFGGSPMGGYTSVSAGNGYNTGAGYGFSGGGVKDVVASGSGALSDAVQFTDSTTTFCVDLPEGLYNVSVTLGNTNRTSVYIENQLQIVNMTGDNAYHSLLVPVTDGQLNIRAAAGKEGYAYTISEIDIQKVSDDPTLPPTVWFCGDSTVCNYYPLENSTQAGWGQVIDKYIDSSKWNVRNMASSGQWAKGFLTSGQFDTIDYYGKQGDIFIISIGINDTNPNYTNESEYYESVTEMVKRAQAKGMSVYLVKQQGRNGDTQRNPLLTGRWFGGTLDKIGSEQNVPVIDLFNLWQNYCLTLSADEVSSLYMPDGLHPNRQGALKLAELASKEINWDGTPPEPVVKPGAVMDTSQTYLIRNKNSGLYLGIEGEAVSGANVAQVEGINGTLWKFTDGGDGYYNITTENESLFLDVFQAKPDMGTNIEVYMNSGSDAQLFKMLDNGDGSYVISTKAGSDNSCIEIKNAYTEPGANAQQWEINGHDCQSWTIEPVKIGEQPDEDLIVGDLNRDGRVNVFDMIILKRTFTDFDDSLRHRGDVNADGDVDDDDLIELEEFLLSGRNYGGRGFYYAKDAGYSNAFEESTNAGFKKDCYINLDNRIGSYIEWNITVPYDGDFIVDFRVSNGSYDERTMNVFVNGEKASDISFPGTGSWTEWNTAQSWLHLKKGRNTVRLVSSCASGGPNFDYMKFQPAQAPIDEPVEEPIIEPADIEPTGEIYYSAE